MKYSPKKLLFSFLHERMEQGTKIMILLGNTDGDEIRSVSHPDWESLWDNICEDVFTSSKFKTDEEAKKWLISIGMKYDEDNDD